MKTPAPPPVTPRPEYPRVQRALREWLNLNGEWEFAFDDLDRGIELGWHNGLPLDRRIIVPFPYQSELSGVNDKSVHEIVWYARSFEAPEEWVGQSVLLQFGAVDYRTTVWVNGREVGDNQGGHVPFHFDVADYLKPGINRLTVRVEDRQDARQPRGKQSISGRSQGVDYYCTTGIWQTVWLEPVPPIRIEEIRVIPFAHSGMFRATVYLHATASLWAVEAEVLDEGDVVVRTRKEIRSSNADLDLTIPAAKLWSPESPYLYEIRIRLYQDGKLLDEAYTYSGMRDVELRNGRVWLNGRPVFLAMVLDHGYWPESHLAAPSDEALRADVEWIKRLGFNCVRKHQKIEDPRWLYWCDRLGVLVWEEMPNAREWGPEAEEMITMEWTRVVQRDYNHPCIIAWVPVNESWGFPELRWRNPRQYASIERLVSLTKRIDPSRPVIDNDGWEHSDVTDICTIHDYAPAALELREHYEEANSGGPLPKYLGLGETPLFISASRYRGQPIILSEVGGFLQLSSTEYQQLNDVLYNFNNYYRTPDELLAKYRGLMEAIASLQCLAGFCYVQLTDVEQETNGLLSADRRPKVAPDKIAGIHAELFDLGT